MPPCPCDAKWNVSVQCRFHSNQCYSLPSLMLGADQFPFANPPTFPILEANLSSACRINLPFPTILLPNVNHCCFWLQELFQSLDQTDTGKVTLASLKGILAMVKEKEFTDEMFAPVKTVVAKVSVMVLAHCLELV